MLSVKGITKVFPGVKALDDVSLSFDLGEIHGLMGENGAGKSTLMKIITGIYQPDAGAIEIDGKKVVMKNFHDSIAHSISIVHQEIQVIPASTVSESIFMDRLEKFRKKSGMLDWKKIDSEACRYLEMVELDVKPSDIIGSMTPAQKQLVQIAKALSADASYILLDEPTSSLSVAESQNLFRILDKLLKQNRGIIFVSHKIEEVLQICDRISVLRDGKVIGTRTRAKITRQELIRMMIARDENISPMGHLPRHDEIVLDARNFAKSGMFDDISLEVRKGEILGLYGLVGSGRTEFVRMLIGADSKDAGQIFINGKKAQIRSINDALNKYRIGYVTENRKEEGLILSYPVIDNMTITILDKMIGRGRKINPKIGKTIADKMSKDMEIKTPSMETHVESLSGGNQQKVSISKWLASGCDILFVDEPTVGVDIGAKRHIHEIIWNLAEKQGKTIILISSDMPEMLSLASRIKVFRDRKIVGEVDCLDDPECNFDEVKDKIGQMMV